MTQSTKPVGKIRWSIAALTGIGILINYFDRSNISLAADPMMKDLHLSVGQFGLVLSAFGWSYAAAQIPFGLLLDRIGITWIMRVCSVLWTLFTLLTAIAGGLGLVMLARVLLGVAEAPAFPASAKASGYWFPLRERGVATASFDGASRFSNVIGAPLIALAITEWGWRGGFWLTAVLSGLFAVVWWIWYRNPRQHPKLTRAELDYIVGSGGAQQEGQPAAGTWRTAATLLRNRKILGLFLGYGCAGYAGSFFIVWLPGYLEVQLHLSVLKTGLYSTIPWIVATLADFFIAGLVVDRLIKSGRNPSRVRRTLITVGILISLTVVFVAFTHDPVVAIVFITTGTAGTVIMSSITWILPAILAPTGAVGAIGGVINFANWGFNTLSTMITGFIVEATGSFTLVIIIAAGCIVLSLYFYVVFIGPYEAITVPARDGRPVAKTMEQN